MRSHLIRYMPKKICSISPNQKVGTDSPKNAAPVEAWSNSEYWRMAE
jgi:hypothetical protein